MRLLTSEPNKMNTITVKITEQNEREVTFETPCYRKWGNWTWYKVLNKKMVVQVSSSLPNEKVGWHIDTLTINATHAFCSDSKEITESEFDIKYNEVIRKIDEIKNSI